MLNRERAIIQSNTLLREETRAIELESLKRTEESFASICDEKAHEDMVRQGRRRLSHKATLGALLIFLYRDEPLLQQPYRLLSLLCDVDENLQMWRYRHMMMVWFSCHAFYLYCVHSHSCSSRTFCPLRLILFCFGSGPSHDWH
jgi:tryptophan 2,3-dioxygenase